MAPAVRGPAAELRRVMPPAPELAEPSPRLTALPRRRLCLTRRPVAQMARSAVLLAVAGFLACASAVAHPPPPHKPPPRSPLPPPPSPPTPALALNVRGARASRGPCLGRPLVADSLPFCAWRAQASLTADFAALTASLHDAMLAIAALQASKAADEAKIAALAGFQTSYLRSVVSYGSAILLASSQNYASGVAVDDVGNVIVAATFDNEVRKIWTNGSITPLGYGFSGPQGVALDGAGERRESRLSRSDGPAPLTAADSSLPCRRRNRVRG